MKEEISKFYFMRKKPNAKNVLIENNIFQIGSIIVKAVAHPL